MRVNLRIPERGVKAAGAYSPLADL